MLKIKIFQMKKNSIKLVILLAISVLFACNESLKFQTTESGIEYAFAVQDEDSPLPQVGEGLQIEAKYYFEPTDSLLFDTKEVSEDFRIEFSEPQYEGSIDEIFAMMRKGDSVVAYVDAVKFFNNSTDVELPDFMKKGDKLAFYIKLKDIVSKEQIAKEEEEYKQMKLTEEKTLISEYLTNKNLTATPTASGLYFIEKEKGRGVKAKTGDMVKVHYTGTFINGEVFDSSQNTGEPFEFELGAGNVIAGWDEAIAMMNQGGKATLVIPCELGYGIDGYYPVIPPYSTLIFEVYLVEVKSK